MFDSVQLGKLQVKNRIVYPPLQENMANKNGTVSQLMEDYYVGLAREGAGLIILESAYVAKQGRTHFSQLGISEESHVEGISRIIRRMKAEGARVGVRLSHAGARTSELLCGEQPIAPSILNFGKDFSTSREFDEGDVEELVLFFVHAAERAEEAGADLIEINGSQHCLLDQCLSNRFNNRADEFGGNIAERMRLSIEIIKAIKKRISTDIPISYFFSIHDKLEDGFTEEDLKGMLKILTQAKLDVLHPVSIHVLNKFFDHEQTLVELVGNAAKQPIIAEGNIKSPQILKETMALKKAQVYALDKALFSRPNWYAFLERKFQMQ